MSIQYAVLGFKNTKFKLGPLEQMFFLNCTIPASFSFYFRLLYKVGSKYD